MEIEINEVLRGVALGVLGGLLAFYSLRTEVPYPSWIVRSYEEPLVKIALFIIVFGITMVDPAMGVLSTLLIVFLHTDISCISCTPIYKDKASDSGSDSEDEKEHFRQWSGNGSPFGPSHVEIITPQANGMDVKRGPFIEGTVLRKPFYPLYGDADILVPGAPAPLEAESK